MLSNSGGLESILNRQLQVWNNRVVGAEIAPNGEGDTLNGKALVIINSARDVEQLGNGTSRATGSTPVQLLSRIYSGGTHSKMPAVLQV